VIGFQVILSGTQFMPRNNSIMFYNTPKGWIAILYDWYSKNV